MTKEQLMNILPVPPDGDCFYHAFISGLGIVATPKDLRNFVASRIEQDNSLYTDILDDWIGLGVIKNGDTPLSASEVASRIRDKKEWATTTVIHILSDAFNVRTVVYKQVGNRCIPQLFPYPWTFDPKSRKFARIIHIYHHGYHFDLLQPIGNDNAADGGVELNNDAKVIVSKNDTHPQVGGGNNVGVQWEPNAGQPTESTTWSFIFGISVILTLFTLL